MEGVRSRWRRVEAGYYSIPFGHRMLEVVHKDSTPADRLHLDRWVVRVVDRPKPTLELGRFPSKTAAVGFADGWRVTQAALERNPS